VILNGEFHVNFLLTPALSLTLSNLKTPVFRLYESGTEWRQENARHVDEKDQDRSLRIHSKMRKQSQQEANIRAEVKKKKKDHINRRLG
jgi:hypothetical protein